MAIQLRAVESTAIAKVGYDPEAQHLAVLFHSGHRYDIGGFSPEAYAKFMAAESLGRHFAAHIRGRYAPMQSQAIEEPPHQPEGQGVQEALDAAIEKYRRDARDALQ